MTSSRPRGVPPSLQRARAARFVSAALVLPCALACTDEVSLGGWLGVPPTGSSAPTAPASSPSEPSAQPAPSAELDAGATAGPAPTEPAPVDASTPDAGAPLPSCGQSVNPGPLNTTGTAFGATEMFTDWTWQAPAESVRWRLMIEQDVVREDPESPATRGYYWSHQFYFAEGVTGIMGLQAEGYYQPDPPDPTAELTKMAVFWLSGPPLQAELGDIAYPDARVAEETAVGADWLTIHAKFDWQVCRWYELSFGPESEDAAGNVWYGAWIEDTESGETTFLGRMLLPADVGLLSPFSIARTDPFNYVEPTSCTGLPYGAAIFGAPMPIGEQSTPRDRSNRFEALPRCGSSRFTDFSLAVRHEAAVPSP